MLHSILGGEVLVTPGKFGAEIPERDKESVRTPGPVADVVDEEGRATDTVRLPAELGCFDTLAQLGNDRPGDGDGRVGLLGGPGQVRRVEDVSGLGEPVLAAQATPRHHGGSVWNTSNT